MALPKLYDLASNYQAVWDMVNDDDTDLDMLGNTLEAIEAAIEQKAHNIAAVMISVEGYTEILDSQIKRLQARKKAFENRHAAMKQYLQNQLEFAGIDKIKTPEFSISVQKNPPAVVIDDENLIPAEYQIIKYDIDKKKIGYYLKEGKEVPGARLAQGRSLRIR